MDGLIEQHLWMIKNNIEPTETQKNNASGSHTYLRSVLDSGNIGNRIKGSYLSGSYARDTAIRPIDDVDVIFLIDPSKWNTSVSRVLLGINPAPAEVLQTFSSAIRYRYPVSSVYHQRRSIRLSLFHLDIDVVPAIPQDLNGNVILIPDTDKDQWIKSAPKLHAEKATQVNQLRGGRFKPLVKILKKWNGGIASTAALKSFTIETLAARIFAEVGFNTLLDGLIYFWDFSSRFGDQQQIYKWNSNFGVNWTYLTGISIPDASGTGSNTSAGVSYVQQIKFAEYAARSRDRLLAAKKSINSTTALGHLTDALYL